MNEYLNNKKNRLLAEYKELNLKIEWIREKLLARSFYTQIVELDIFKSVNLCSLEVLQSYKSDAKKLLTELEETFYTVILN